MKFLIIGLQCLLLLRLAQGQILPTPKELKKPDKTIKRTIPCETCQIIVYDTKRLLQEKTKRKDSSGYAQLDAINIIESECDLDRLRLFGERALIPAKKIVDQCKDMLDEMSDELEELIPKQQDEKNIREKVCKTYCKETGLWAEGDEPHSRFSKHEYSIEGGKRFLAENKNVDGVIETKSGLQYKVLRKGYGTHHPTPEAKVRVHYTGTKLDGTEFETTKGKNPNRFSPMDVIAGWNEALQMMVCGDIFQVFIPFNLGYGEAGSGSGVIGGGELLIFEMHLVEIVDVEGGDDAPEEFKDKKDDGNDEKQKSDDDESVEEKQKDEL